MGVAVALGGPSVISMKRYYLIVTASKPTETDAAQRIKQFIAFGRRLGLRIELGPDCERPQRARSFATHRFRNS